VIPVALKLWQPIRVLMPAFFALLLIIRHTSGCAIRFSESVPVLPLADRKRGTFLFRLDPGDLHVCVDLVFKDVMDRHLVPLTALLVEPHAHMTPLHVVASKVAGSGYGSHSLRK
jgi:hypothetical protein